MSQRSAGPRSRVRQCTVTAADKCVHVNALSRRCHVTLLPMSGTNAVNTIADVSSDVRCFHSHPPSPAGDDLAENETARGVVVCVHVFGLGIWLPDYARFGHVNVTHMGARGAHARRLSGHRRGADDTSPRLLRCAAPTSPSGRAAAGVVSRHPSARSRRRHVTLVLTTRGRFRDAVQCGYLCRGGCRTADPTSPTAPGGHAALAAPSTHAARLTKRVRAWRRTTRGSLVCRAGRGHLSPDRRT
jgi:hypothetical protein